MSARRAQSLPPHMLDEKPARGKCITAICFSWKVLSCVVSHVALVLLVVSYCVGGAYLFQHLEKPHEIEVKRDIQNIRLNLTDKIWKFSDNVSVLSENDWIANVKKDLASFEKQILTAIKTDGWDGDEDVTKSQWTFAGSLFYSIIVITTIGYGHISPRTDWGKVTTIFYAIVGIPLMLLCLSNIGDVMATSFRFIYWRVCCYVCTRAARRPRRPRQRSMRAQRYSSRSQPPPFRRSIRLTQRSGADSGFGNSIGVPHAYSDPELRTSGRNDYDGGRNSGGRHGRHQHMSSSQRNRASPYAGDQYDDEPQYTQTLNRGSRFGRSVRNRQSMRDRHTVERERYLAHSKQRLDSMEELNALPPAKRTYSVRSMRASSARRDEAPPPPRESREPVRESREMREINRMNPRTLQRGRSMPNPPPTGRAKSVDPRIHYEDVDEEMVRKTPIIPNRYAIDELDHREHHRGKHMPRSQSMPRSALHKSNFHGDQRNGGGSGADSYHSHHHHHQRHMTPQPPMPQHSQSNRTNYNRQHSRFGDRLELPEFGPPQMNHTKRGRSPGRRDDYEDEYDNYYMDERDLPIDDYDDRDMYREPSRSRERKPRRERRERLPPSPRIMSPMGFAVKRQVRRRPSYDYDDDSMYGDDWSDYYGDLSPKDRPVPIWLCVFLVISYILGGAVLFAYWEEWSFLDSAYFCFITLTTIGFGDFVPAKGVKDESEQSIAYCSLYLLFGIALLAMSFNLVQEEFIANVKEVARRLGILKDEEDDD